MLAVVLFLSLHYSFPPFLSSLLLPFPSLSLLAHLSSLLPLSLLSLPPISLPSFSFPHPSLSLSLLFSPFCVLSLSLDIKEAIIIHPFSIFLSACLALCLCLSPLSFSLRTSTHYFSVQRNYDLKVLRLCGCKKNLFKSIAKKKKKDFRSTFFMAD